MKQYYAIAGLVVEMDSFGKTELRAAPYRCAPASPDIWVCSDWQEFQKRHPYLSDEDCEYLRTGVSFNSQLLKYNGLFLHSSAVVVDGKAYLFSAPCGTGKSTHTGLWLKVFGDRAYILNDDKPALRFEDGVWYAYGTPWSGKHDISRNARVEIAGICFLHQAKENTIAPLSGTEAIHSLLDQTTRPPYMPFRIKLMELIDSLLEHVPVWQMGCNMDPEAVTVSYTAMSSKKKE